MANNDLSNIVKTAFKRVIHSPQPLPRTTIRTLRNRIIDASPEDSQIEESEFSPSGNSTLINSDQPSSVNSSENFNLEIETKYTSAFADEGDLTIKTTQSGTDQNSGIRADSTLGDVAPRNSVYVHNDNPFVIGTRNLTNSVAPPEPVFIKQENMADFDLTEFRELIPVFDGKTAEITDFMGLVDLMHGDLSEQGKRALLAKLRYKLRDEPGELFAAGGFNNWAELRAILQTKYRPRISYDEAKTQLKEIKQKPGEKVRTYADRIKKALANVTQATEEKYNDEVVRTALANDDRIIALKTFKNGLNPTIQSVVKGLRNVTLKKP